MKLEECDTIHSIKNKIFKKHKIPHDQQDIIFSDSRPSDVSNIPRLEDAKLAGKDSQNCTLILTEGDSAKSLVMMGLTVVNDREHYGVFPLRGKLPNATRASMKKVLKNNVINSLTRILGLVCDEEVLGKMDGGVDIRKSLRYGRILLMMDQDHDGTHIKGLVINLIHRMWPTLVRTKDSQFIHQFTTPIVKATDSISHTVKSFYTIQALEDWRKDENNVSNWRIKYYKGLGSSTDDEAVKYFKEMDQSTNIFTWRNDLDSNAIKVAFDKTEVEARRNWILSFQSNNCLDRDERHIPFKDFIDKEYILYAKAKLRRNIPSIMDGLVPAQRKILYCSLKKNLVKEMKVSQFIGCVSSECAYHHDEDCLAQIVIKMAQNFVGRNNINLLKPIGQYGSCNLGGKDHASHRYLNTELSSITRFLFCNDDDKILHHNLDEDGKTIEPEWFLPVIPMILVNGSQGIGIGWNSFVPKYNPTNIINNIKHNLNDESIEEMTPWYKGFKGTIVPKDNGRYHIDGLVTRGKGKYTYHIKELPIGTSIEGYKNYLKSISKGTEKKKTPLIKKFEQIGDSRTVGFHIEFIPEEAPSKDDHDGLIKILNLRTTISTNDMNLYDKENHIKKFNSAEEILEHFYSERLEKYKTRRDVMLGNIESDLIDLNSTRDFVNLVRSKKVDFFTKDSKDLQEICMDHNIAADSLRSLLSLPLSTFFDEGLKKVKDKTREKEDEMNALFNKTAIQLWKEDLDTFEEEWQKEEASWKSDTMSQACPICEPPIHSNITGGGNSNAAMGQELLGRGRREIKLPIHLNDFHVGSSKKKGNK